MAGLFIKLLLKYWGLTIFQEGSPGRARMLNNRFVKRVLINAQNFLGVVLSASSFSFPFEFFIFSFYFSLAICYTESFLKWLIPLLNSF